MIHQSKAPHDDSYIVSAGTMYTIVGLIFVGLIGIICIMWVVWNMSVQIDDFNKFNDIVIERRKAFDEMLTKRARVQQWTYKQVCDNVKSQGRECLDNPEWWADPKRYPLLTGADGAGSGLLPPENK